MRVVLSPGFLELLQAARAGTGAATTLWSDSRTQHWYADTGMQQEDSTGELVEHRCRVVPRGRMDWELQGPFASAPADQGVYWFVFLKEGDPDESANERGEGSGDAFFHKAQLLEELRDNSRFFCGTNEHPVELILADTQGVWKASPPPSGAVAHPSTERHHRTLVWLGSENFGRVTGAVLGIIGAGGVSNQFVLQAIHHGYRRFVIIDHDLLDTSNLNRFQGVTAADVGSAKAELLARAVRAYATDSELTVLVEEFPSTNTRAALGGVDILVSGVDNDRARLLVQVFACQRNLPLFDMGSGIFLQEGTGFEPVVDEAGGQVRAALPGGPCLVCQGLPLDTLRDSQGRAIDEARGYLAGTALTPPSVITLNSVVASLCLRMITNYLTGHGVPVPHVRYDEVGLTMAHLTHTRNGGCVVCGVPAVTST